MLHVQSADPRGPLLCHWPRWGNGGAASMPVSFRDGGFVVLWLLSAQVCRACPKVSAAPSGPAAEVARPRDRAGSRVHPWRSSVARRHRFGNLPDHLRRCCPNLTPELQESRKRFSASRWNALRRLNWSQIVEDAARRGDPGKLAGLIAIGLRSIGFFGKLLYAANAERHPSGRGDDRSRGQPGASAEPRHRAENHARILWESPFFAGISIFEKVQSLGWLVPADWGKNCKRRSIRSPRGRLR